MLLALVFLSLTLLVFAVVAIMTRPTAEQSAMEKRIAETVTTHAGRTPLKDQLPTHLKVTHTGPFQAIDRLLARTWLSRELQILIVQAQAPFTVGTVLVSASALVLALFLAVYLASSMLLLALGVAALSSFLPVFFLRFKRSRRVRAFDLALPDCIEMCARALRVGNSVVAAIEIIANESVEPAKTEFAEVFKKQNYGLPLRDALLQMLDRVPSMDLQVFVTGIMVQRDTGGNLAEILDRIVFVIRERLRIQREVRTHTAQGRLTGWILCLLPPAMLLMINITNPGYSSVLFHEELGRKMLYGGTGLLLLGAFLIRRIVNGVEV